MGFCKRMPPLSWLRETQETWDVGRSRSLTTSLPKRMEPRLRGIDRQERFGASVRHTLAQARFRDVGTDDKCEPVVRPKDLAVCLCEQTGDSLRLRRYVPPIEQDTRPSQPRSHAVHASRERGDIGSGFFDRPAASGIGPDQSDAGIVVDANDVLLVAWPTDSHRIIHRWRILQSPIPVVSPMHRSATPFCSHEHVPG